MTERRTLIILGSVAGALLIAVVVVLSVYLVQSTRSASPAPEPPAAPATTAPPTSSAPVAPTPTATPTPDAEGPLIDVTGTGFTIANAEDEVTFTHEWAGDAAPAIAALTEVFGAAPSEDFQNGDAENYAYNIYVWEGFRLYDVSLGEGNRPRAEVPAPTYVSFDTDIDDPVRVEDEFGVSLGMPIAEARALGPVSESALPDGGVRLVFGADRGSFYNDGARNFSAYVDSDAAGQSVQAITFGFRVR